LTVAPVGGFGALFLAELIRVHGEQFLQRVAEEKRLHPELVAEARRTWAAVEQAGQEWVTWWASVDGSKRPQGAEIAAPSEVITTREAADMLRISERRVRQLLAEGRLTGTHAGRVWLVDRASVKMLAAVRGAA
jgi:excisionase family DNA binding protein